MQPNPAKIPEVRLANHPMTSKSRMYVTKAGSWTKNAMEGMSYDQWTGTFSSSTVESRNRPNYGLQEFAHTLVLGEDKLRLGLQQGIYGPAVQQLVDQIGGHREALAQLDGASKVVKSAASVKAAVKEIVEWLAQLATKPKLKRLLPVLWTNGEIARHVAQQLAEWVSVAGDPVKFASEVPRVGDQPCSSLMREVNLLVVSALC